MTSTDVKTELRRMANQILSRPSKGYDLFTQAAELIEERDRLHAQNEELRKDKERLDWLQESNWCRQQIVMCKVGNNLRTAIDSARKSSA